MVQTWAGDSGFFWPLPSDPCCTFLSLNRQAGLGLSTKAFRVSLQSYGRAMLQGHLGICLGAPRPLGEDKEGQIRSLVALMPATRKCCPVGLWEVRVWRVSELPLYLRGSFFCSQAWQTEQLRQLRRGPWKGKGKKKKEKSVAQVFCVHKGWPGGAQAQLRRCPLHIEGPARGRLKFGRWLRFGEAKEGWQ